ncbi:MAG: hypothetical protein RLZZ210_1468, partial [Pseudomonadota bacterium]
MLNCKLCKSEEIRKNIKIRG